MSDYLLAWFVSKFAVTKNAPTNICVYYSLCTRMKISPGYIYIKAKL